MFRLIKKMFIGLLNDYTIKWFGGSLQSNYKEPIKQMVQKSRWVC